MWGDTRTSQAACRLLLADQPVSQSNPNSIRVSRPNTKGCRGRKRGMDVPSLETPEGVFDYLIAGLVLLALAFGVAFAVLGGLL